MAAGFGVVLFSYLPAFAILYGIGILLSKPLRLTGNAKLVGFLAGWFGTAIVALLSEPNAAVGAIAKNLFPAVLYGVVIGLGLATVISKVAQNRIKHDRDAAFTRIGQQGFTELMFFSADGAADKIAELLDLGVDINAQDRKGGTALFYAIKNEHQIVLELLLSRGADRTIRNSDGFTAAEFATKLGHRKLAKLLN